VDGAAWELDPWKCVAGRECWELFRVRLFCGQQSVPRLSGPRCSRSPSRILLQKDRFRWSSADHRLFPSECICNTECTILFVGTCWSYFSFHISQVMQNISQRFSNNFVNFSESFASIIFSFIFLLLQFETKYQLHALRLEKYLLSQHLHLTIIDLFIY